MTGTRLTRTLPQLFREADWRRFRAKNQNSRWAEILGPGPRGTEHYIGWWDGSTQVQEFDGTEATWTEFVRYK